MNQKENITSLTEEPPVLELRQITKKFGKTTVLQNVNLVCRHGNIYGIIGHNGSGKTVMFKILCGLYQPDSGSVFVRGEPLGEHLLSDTGIIIDSPAFLPGKTGFQNLDFLYCLNHKRDKQHLKKIMEQMGLDPASRKRVQHYSLGMRQRLALAQAIMEDPEILILDEPMNGLDKNGIQEIRALLLAWKAQGKTILLASHNKEDIEVLCDEVYEMEMGILSRIPV